MTKLADSNEPGKPILLIQAQAATRRAHQTGTMDPLLKALRSGVWTERWATRFEQTYGRRLRWQVLAHMEKLGLLLHRVSPETVPQLSARRMELYENTLSDLWDELLAGLVPRYVKGVEQGKVRQSFSSYTGGVIRHLVIDNARRLQLLPEETPNQLLRSLSKAKEKGTQRRRLAWAKYCLEHRVRSELLALCPQGHFNTVYANIHRVCDYFFERFIPQQSAVILSLKGNLLPILVDRFLKESSAVEHAIAYCGHVAPYARGENVRMDSIHDAEEHSISALAWPKRLMKDGVGQMDADRLHEERLGLWDKLLKGELIDADALEHALAPLLRSVGDEEKESCMLLIAAAHVGWRGRTSCRRTLTAALRYWWSKSGTPYATHPPAFEARSLDNAGLLEVTDLNLTWEEALTSVGVKKRNVDYTSLHRLVKKLERRYREVQARLLGEGGQTSWTDSFAGGLRNSDGLPNDETALGGR